MPTCIGLYTYIDDTSCLSILGARGPGLVFIMPCIDTYRKLDLRVVSYAVPPQEILSKDSVTVSVDAVVYFRTSDPIAAVNNVDDAIYSTKLLAQTTLRNALGMKTLSEMLTEREAIAQLTETILDEGTEHWGIKVERVEVKDIRLPQQVGRQAFWSPTSLWNRHSLFSLPGPWPPKPKLPEKPEPK